MPVIFKDAKKVRIEQLYLDPNNPRLAGNNAPGYNDSEPLFDEARQVELIDIMCGRSSRSSTVKKDEYGVDELITTIMAKGWIADAEPIWVWEHPDVPHKYTVLEGNRRTTAMKLICSVHKERAVATLAAAQKANNTPRIEELQEQLRIISQIEEAASNLEVKPLNAGSEEELTNDLTVLLSVRHINGAKPWDGDAADIWLRKRYEEMYRKQFPDSTTFAWNTSLITELAREASITKINCSNRLKAITWYDDFKVMYATRMPKGSDGRTDDFRKGDYFLFKQLAKNKVVKEKVFKIKDEDVRLSEPATEALFQWVFEKPSHGDAADNTNKFYAHRCIDYLGQMLKWDSTPPAVGERKTSLASGYDIENPGDAPMMAEVYDIDFRNAKLNAAQSNVLDRTVTALKRITTGELYEDGESIKEQITYIHNYTGKLLRDMDNKNG